MKIKIVSYYTVHIHAWHNQRKRKYIYIYILIEKCWGLFATENMCFTLIHH